jgi:hypothetical protein
MDMTYMALFLPKLSSKRARSGNEPSDWLATEFPFKEQSKTNFIIEIAKVK